MHYCLMIREEPGLGWSSARGNRGYGNCGGRRGGISASETGGEEPRGGYVRNIAGFGGDGFGGPEFGSSALPAPRTRERFVHPIGNRRGFGRGKARRSEVRAAVLNLLNEQPMTGYQLMAAIEQRTQGLWIPGPGLIYPALQMLCDEGFIGLVENDTDAKKPYALTDEGKSHLEAHPEKAKAPWGQVSLGVQGLLAVRPAMEKLVAVVQEMAARVNQQQQAKIRQVLDNARAQLRDISAEQTHDGNDEDTKS